MEPGSARTHTLAFINIMLLRVFSFYGKDASRANYHIYMYNRAFYKLNQLADARVDRLKRERPQDNLSNLKLPNLKNVTTLNMVCNVDFRLYILPVQAVCL